MRKPSSRRVGKARPMFFDERSGRVCDNRCWTEAARNEVQVRTSTLPRRVG